MKVTWRTDLDAQIFDGRTTIPYTSAAGDAGARSYDLIGHPERTKEAMRDFTPWVDRPAVKDLYACVDWINGQTSSLETFDSAFKIGTTVSGDKQQGIRLMIGFRRRELNLLRGTVDAFAMELYRQLRQTGPDLASTWFEMHSVGRSFYELIPQVKLDSDDLNECIRDGNLTAVYLCILRPDEDSAFDQMRRGVSWYLQAIKKTNEIIRPISNLHLRIEVG